MESVTDPKMLEDRVFYKVGLKVYDYHKIIIILGLVCTIALTSLVTMGADWAEGFGEDDVEAIEAGKLLSERFSSSDENAEARQFQYIVFHESLNDSNSIWQQSVIDALSSFAEHDNVTILYSWEVEEVERDDYFAVKETGNYSINTIFIHLDRKEAKVVYDDLRESVVIDDGFKAWKTSDLAIDNSFDTRIQGDLIKAEMVSGPLSIVILGIVFGSVVAALLPIGAGVVTVAAAMGVTIWMSNVTDVTQYSTNIISLIGIGVSIDYSLFLVNRFREELGRGRDIRTATAMSMATAGKAVFYSGITVAIGLMGMLFFENTGLPSLGLGGTIAVTIAMLNSTILLPAIMAVLGHRVNKWKIPYSIDMVPKEDGFWANIAKRVMDRPWLTLLPVLILLVGAGLPFMYAEFSLSSVNALPPDDEARNGLDIRGEVWPDQDNNYLFLVLESEDLLSEENLRAQHAYLQSLLDDDRILSVSGIGLPDASMNESQVIGFWTTPDEYLDNQTILMREHLRQAFIGEGVTMMLLTLEGDETSVQSREVVEDIRADRDDLLSQTSDDDDRLLVGGFAAYNADNLNAIKENLPIALAFIFIATTVLIFIQVRSVVIPLKAIAMNILSVSASFGMLVWVFQWGYGADLLNFTAQPIDSGNPVIMFCIVFGLSMDYEVLMLSRIHEEWERTGDNTLAVANGLQKTGGLITGAAAIMVIVFSAFGLSSVIILKQIGFGLALAILIDATLVRALVVPSTMRLMGKWNWWSPAFLAPKKKALPTDAPTSSEE